MILLADSKDLDQTVRMRRVIFADRICPKIRFYMVRSINMNNRGLLVELDMFFFFFFFFFFCNTERVGQP